MRTEQDESRRVVCAPSARATLLADLTRRPRIEACGLLLGTAHGGEWLVEDVVPLRNTNDAANYFEFDPADLLEQDLRWGSRIIGAYHSHPGGPPRPSRVDFDNMRDNGASPWVWLILSPSGASPLGPLASGAWRNATVAAFRVERETVIQFPVAVMVAADAAAATDQTRPD